MQLYQILEVIKAKVTEQPYGYNTGLCYLMYQHLKAYRLEPCYSQWHGLKQLAFAQWEQYSGDAQFPVPSPDSMSDPEQAFDNGCKGRVMFDPDHPYGKARLELLDHLISYYRSIEDVESRS